MNFDIQILIDRMWWNTKENKPYNCFIVGDKSTTINLGWFEFINGEWSLTKNGNIHYAILLNNNAVTTKQN